MTVESKKVTGRRSLSFSSIDEILADCKMLVDADAVKELGNWKMGDIFFHLGKTMEFAVTGEELFKANLFFKIMGKLMKKGMLTKPMKPGFKLPIDVAKKVYPEKPVPVDEAWSFLQEIAEKFKEKDDFGPNPIFGKMSKEDYTNLQLRHAELHLSFLIPTKGDESISTR